MFDWNNRSEEEIEYYKKRACASCLWEKPCKYFTCVNGIYSNLSEKFIVWVNHEGQWLIDRQDYYQFNKINKRMQIVKGQEEKVVEFMLESSD